jgi:hypothetical protein
LVDALFDRACILQRRHLWPWEVRDLHQIERPYLKHLAKLVLDEDASPQQFNTAPELFSIYLGISEKTWHYQVRERFGALKLDWGDWLSNAARIIQSHLRDRDDCDVE